jgi:hypothetical protein
MDSLMMRVWCVNLVGRFVSRCGASQCSASYALLLVVMGDVFITHPGALLLICAWCARPQQHRCELLAGPGCMPKGGAGRAVCIARCPSPCSCMTSGFLVRAWFQQVGGVLGWGVAGVGPALLRPT